MKIVFYSTNSNNFDNNSFHINTYPTVNSIFDNFCNKHKDVDFYVVTQRPCFFLPDNLDNSESNIKILSEHTSINDMAQAIKDINPDFAISMTYWVDPFDWLTINDSLVAESLEKSGIKTISHPTNSGMICFDKTKTHEKLKALGFNIPNAIFVDHDMYFCAGSNKKVIHNVYKDYIANEIKKLTLPLIIKDTVGVSSYGTTVVHSYGEAIGYLNSKRNNSNRIVEEYISGQQFGTEIYGDKGNYSIMPPLTFSLNQYGITSPKLSVKYGPVDNDINIKNLNIMLTKLCEELGLRGVAQFDLVYSNNQWYIIEINPRLSGMTYTYSYLLGKSIFSIVYDSTIENKKIELLDENRKVINIKLPVISLEEFEMISKIDGVDFVHLTNDDNARQEREKGYCEIIISSNSLSNIKNILNEIRNLMSKEDFSNIFSFVEKID